jgi:hypothetical protein
MSAAGNSRRSHARDRAAVVATAIIHIVVTALRSCLHGEWPDAIAAARAKIEALLREEFDEISRKTRDEIRLVD